MGGANVEFLREYVAALRSGNYPQIRGQLRNDQGYDALGVATDVLIKRGVLPPWERRTYKSGASYYHPEGQTTTLIPAEAAHVVGISPLIDFPVGYDDDHLGWTFSSVLELSDDTTYTFDVIADAVEQAFGLTEGT